jgi:hypothetical protein
LEIIIFSIYFTMLSPITKWPTSSPCDLIVILWRQAINSHFGQANDLGSLYFFYIYFALFFFMDLNNEKTLLPNAPLLSTKIS